MIHCHQLCYQYGQQSVLNNLSVSLEAGQIHVLLGPSGCGKTTLLHILTQLTPADSGSLQLFNQQLQFPYSKANPAPSLSLAKVGLVFQQHGLWPHLSCLKNLTLAPIKVLKISPAVAEKKAKDYLAQFGLSHKAMHKPTQLSGGEQQKIAIIRSLMMPFDAIALDEPNAALDPLSTQDLAQTLLQLQAAGKTLIISTHDIAFAKLVADQVHFLQQGRIIESNDRRCFTAATTTALQRFLQQHPGRAN